MLSHFGGHLPLIDRRTSAGYVDHLLITQAHVPIPKDLKQVDKDPLSYSVSELKRMTKVDLVWCLSIYEYTQGKDSK